MDIDLKYNVIYADPPWSFKTYSEALNAIRLLTQIEGLKAEVKCH